MSQNGWYKPDQGGRRQGQGRRGQQPSRERQEHRPQQQMQPPKPPRQELRPQHKAQRPQPAPPPVERTAPVNEVIMSAELAAEVAIAAEVGAPEELLIAAELESQAESTAMALEPEPASHAGQALPPIEMAPPQMPRRPRPPHPGRPGRPTPPVTLPAEEGPVRVGTRDPYGDMPENIHSLTVGDRGPVLRHDTQLHETLEEFTHEKIVERTVHVKGFGAFGSFQPYQSMSPHTMLSFLQSPGQQTPVAVRFSLAVSNKGTPDTSRNVRGFSTKFYTDQGNFDLLCNHLPVFSVRDAIRFPESIKAFLPSPVNNLLDPDRFWDFVARAPESMNFVIWLYSDVGTIGSLRKIRGFGVNTYVWRNAQGQKKLVKYHWLPLAGEEYITAQEAAKLSAQNPDYCGRDLYDTIAAGKPVEYELRVQLMDPAEAAGLPYDPLDCTKTWDEEAFPLLPVGRMTLNRNPDNFMEQTEKIAFSPANLLPGAELSDDKMLQGRSTIYWDAQRYRLGTGFREIPINRQRGEFDSGKLVTSGLGDRLDGVEERVDLKRTDDFAQAGQRYRSLSAEQQDHMVENIAGDLKAVNSETKAVVLSFLSGCDPELGMRVAGQMNQ